MWPVSAKSTTPRSCTGMDGVRTAGRRRHNRPGVWVIKDIIPFNFPPHGVSSCAEAHFRSGSCRRCLSVSRFRSSRRRRRGIGRHRRVRWQRRGGRRAGSGSRSRRGFAAAGRGHSGQGQRKNHENKADGVGKRRQVSDLGTPLQLRNRGYLPQSPQSDTRQQGGAETRAFLAIACTRALVPKGTIEATVATATILRKPAWWQCPAVN